MSGVPALTNPINADTITVDNTAYPAVSTPIPTHWRDAARAQNFDLICRARDRYTVVLRCQDCASLSLVRRNVLLDHRPLCHACIHAEREAEARACGAQLLSRDPERRHYGLYELACGHQVSRQFHRVSRAAAGGHRLGCAQCRELRFAEEALAFGWQLLPAPAPRTGYRRYTHACGHNQDIAIGNMAWGDCECSNCGAGWPAEPSTVYLFRIVLPAASYLKLGFSRRPEKRLRHQIGLCPKSGSEVLRQISMSTGRAAQTQELKAHRYMRAHHPEWIVPYPEYSGSLSVRSEIYRLAALPELHRRMDAIETQTSPLPLQEHADGTSD